METPNVVAETAQNQQVIIIPNPELQEIIEKHKLHDADALRLQKEFGGSFAIFQEWEQKNATLSIERADQANEIALAGEGAKAVQKARLAFTKAWKEVKDPYLKTTQALDAINRYALAKFEPLEAELKEKSETAVRLAKAEKDLLIADRKAKLIEVGHSGDLPGLGELDESIFAAMLIGFKAQADAKKADDERKEALEQANIRLSNLESQLEHLGAVYGVDRFYVLANESFDAAIEGISQDEADAVLARFRKESDRLKVVEQTGRDRRETLLAISVDLPWQDLGKLTEDQWAIAHKAHKSAYDAEQFRIEQDRQRKERTAARTLQIVAFGPERIDFNENGMLGYRLGNSSVTDAQIESFDDGQWAAIIADFTESSDAIEQEAKEREAKIARTADRKLKIVALGATIGDFSVPDGDRATIGEYSVSLADIADAKDDEFAIMLDYFTNERDRLALEEAARLRKVRERVETANKRVSELARYEMYKLTDEVADLGEQEYQVVLLGAQSAFDHKKFLSDRYQTRKESLIALGASWANHWYLGDCTCTGSDVEDLSNEEWAPIYERFAEAKKAKDDAAIEKQRQALQAEQAAQQAASDAAAKKIADAAAKKAAAFPDKTKLSVLAEDLRNYAYPDCKTEQGKKVVDSTKSRMQTIADLIDKMIAEM